VRGRSRPQRIMVNRNQGAGTRILIGRLLGGAPGGYWNQPRSHNAVAAAVAQHRADWGMTIAPVAHAAVLLIPLAKSIIDFALVRLESCARRCRRFSARWRPRKVARRWRRRGSGRRSRSRRFTDEDKPCQKTSLGQMKPSAVQNNGLAGHVVVPRTISTACATSVGLPEPAERNIPRQIGRRASCRFDQRGRHRLTVMPS